MSTANPPNAGPEGTPATPTVAKVRSRSAWTRLKRAFWLLAVGVVILFAAYIWLMLKFSYSDGERAGYVQKFSRKGWVCKTWEGELAMATLPGTLPEVFPFTVWDDAVAAQINARMGQRVVLHYREKVGLPTSCFGDTRHIVDQARPVTAP